MAKKTTKTTKTTHHSTTERDIEKFCAFWAMVIAAIMYVFSGIINLVIGAVNSITPDVASILRTICTIVTFLGNIALIIAIAIPAYHYAAPRGQQYRIVYWIFLVIFALGSVLGMIGSFL